MNSPICNNLLTSVCFNSSYIGITYCTLTNATNGLGWCKVSDEIFDGTNVNWEKFFDVRDKEIELMQKGTPREECRNCQQIYSQEWNNDRQVHYILLSTWQVCNSNCIYCLGHIDPLPENSPFYNQHYKNNIEPYNVLDIVKDMVKHNILAKDAKIDFAGGEPTMYPKFDELLNFFIDNGFKNIIIHTNNIQYSEAIARGIKQNAVSLMISIDAGSKKCHKLVKRVDSFDKVWKNFKTYSKQRTNLYDKKLSTKYVIVPNCNDSKKEIEEFIKNSRKNGATQVAFNVYNQLLNEMNYETSLLYGLVDLTNFAIKKAKDNKIKIELFPNIEYVYQKLNLKVEL